MARCTRCGREMWSYRRLCHSCTTKWLERRKAAFSQTKKEFGEGITKDNLKAFTKRMKKLEKEAKEKEEADGTET